MMLMILFFLVGPTITVPPRATAVLKGGSMEFSCFAVGTPAPMIHWEFQGETVGTGNILSIGKTHHTIGIGINCLIHAWCIDPMQMKLMSWFRVVILVLLLILLVPPLLQQH